MIFSAFSTVPGKVFDGTASTGADKETWGTCTNAFFGAGATNSTVYAYCYILTTGVISKVYSRALNATLLSNGTADTTMAIGVDAEYGVSTAILSGPSVATGLGNMALVYAAMLIWLRSSICRHIQRWDWYTNCEANHIGCMLSLSRWDSRIYWKWLCPHWP
mgnify:CR=1 FL=1